MRSWASRCRASLSSRIPTLLLAAGLVTSAVACAPRETSDTPAADPSELARLRLPDGPLEEIRVRRDTRGGFVVSGFSYFPEHTRLGLVLYDSDGRALARTQAEVVSSLFQSAPLAPPDGSGWPAGAYEILIEAIFAPGAQPERVLESSQDGAALSGDGMTTTVQGRPAFAKRVPFMVPGDGA